MNKVTGGRKEWRKRPEKSERRERTKKSVKKDWKDRHEMK